MVLSNRKEIAKVKEKIEETFGPSLSKETLKKGFVKSLTPLKITTEQVKSLYFSEFKERHDERHVCSIVNGVMTICQTPGNPYNGSLYAQSRKLSDCVLDAFVEKTGAKKQRVWETDTMSGINWATVPTTIVEMGYMSNPQEDEKMATEEYQRLMAEGIANGIDGYFGIK